MLNVAEVEELALLPFEIVAEHAAGDFEQALPLLADVYVGLTRAMPRIAVTATSRRTSCCSRTTSTSRKTTPRASEQIDHAIHAWSEAGFHVQHIWHLRADVEIALYERRGMLAWTKLAQSWRAARTSLVARVQFTRMVLEDVRGRAALAAAAEAVTERERGRLIDMAGRAAKRLDAENAPWGSALAMMIRAGQSFDRGRREQGLRQLRTAEPLLQKLEMHLHAAAARRLLDDPSGTEWMTAQGITNPEVMTRLLLPW